MRDNIDSYINGLQEGARIVMDALRAALDGEPCPMKGSASKELADLRARILELREFANQTRYIAVEAEPAYGEPFEERRQPQKVQEKEMPWWFPEAASPQKIEEEGWKYSDTWDHTGDAREHFEHLADAYLALRAGVEEILESFDGDAEAWMGRAELSQLLEFPAQ